MTLLRFLAIIYCSLLLLPAASGQDAQTLTGEFQLTGEQVIVLDTASVDSVDSSLVIPNVFTPNGDGIHDYFEVNTNGVTVYDFNVFTRTGTRFFIPNRPGYSGMGPIVPELTLVREYFTM